MSRAPSPASAPRRAAAALAAAAALGLAAWGASRPAATAPVAALPPDAAPPETAPAAAPAPAAASPAPAPAPPERLVSRTRRVGANGTPGQVLAALGLPAPEVQAVLAALSPHLPFRRVRPGDQVRVERAEGDGALRSVTWRQGPADEVLVRPCGEGLCGERRDVPVSTEVVRVEVVLRTSLYEALQAAGADPALAVAASDVLAWDVDFYQDVRAGDALRLVVERQHAEGRFLRWGDVLAVEFDGRIAGRKRLFRYTDPDGSTAYYDDAGQSARRGFLRAPVPLVHLTSRFGGRRHPLLGYVRAHQGVDYAAPHGTPVWSVGDGVVTQAGWSGGCGMTVAVRHRSGFETVYCHLSRIDVAAGSRVAQKQVLGAVGKTGLATGPHLHFAVRQGGGYVNPLRLQLPRGAPVREEWLADFEAKVAPVRERLDRRPVAWAG